jgi:alpha-tubulin suppressor-like RCC1 family protein
VHSLLLSCDGDIYVFGSNDYGQLGTDVEDEKQLTPKKLIHSNKFIDIASHSFL